MATSAASARKWLEDQQPANEEVLRILEKLVTRIEAWTGEDEQIQGSIEAADILQSYLDKPSSPGAAHEDTEIPAFDSSSLIPDAETIAINKEEKRARFEALKSQLNNLPQGS